MNNFKYLTLALVFIVLNALECQAQLKENNNQNYLLHKKVQLSKLKSSNPRVKFLQNIINQPTEVIDITNYPKYQELPKQTFTPQLINENCNILPINYKTSQQEIGLFFPAKNYENSIYPGAVYRFSTIKNLAPIPYTRFTVRNPMDLTTNIFDANISNNEPVVITNFDYGTISSQWKNILAQYINGVTPAKYQSDIVLLESNSQIKTFFNTISTVDVETKLKVPLVKIPVTVSLGNKVSVSSGNTQNSVNSSSKNSVIVRVKQVFYSSSVSLKANQDPNIFVGVTPSDLEDDLVYVSDVEYGQIFYIVFTSSYSKKEILQAVSNKITTKTELGAEVTGFPVTASVGVATSNQTNTETEMILNSESTKIETFQYGGNATFLGTTLDQILSKLATINTKFDRNNIGAPLSYTLRFVKDHSPAFINTDLSYATTNCGVTLANRRYDVKLTLEHLNAKKVVDNDNSEDIYGNLKMTKFEINGQKKHDEYIFWDRKGETYDNNANGVTAVLKDINTNIKKSKIIGSNLTFNDVVNGKIYVTGKLNDKDVFNPSYTCKECNGSPYQLNLKSYQEEIASITTDKSKKIKLGSGEFFTMNFYENGDANSSHVRAFWTVEITAK